MIRLRSIVAALLLVAATPHAWGPVSESAGTSYRPVFARVSGNKVVTDSYLVLGTSSRYNAIGPDSRGLHVAAPDKSVLITSKSSVRVETNWG